MHSKINAYLNTCFPSQQSPETLALWTLDQFALIALLLTKLEVGVGQNAKQCAQNPKALVNRQWILEQEAPSQEGDAELEMSKHVIRDR